MPLIRRDISIVIDESADEETLGDAVRTALGDRIDDLESVEVLNITSYSALPVQARARLALNPHQVNALLRITLRPLSTTLQILKQTRYETASTLHSTKAAFWNLSTSKVGLRASCSSTCPQDPLRTLPRDDWVPRRARAGGARRTRP